MKTINKEILFQGVLWASSIVTHFLIIIVLVCVYKGIDISSLSFMLSTFIAGLMGNSILILRNGLSRTFDEDRLLLTTKIKSRILLIFINVFATFTVLLFLIYLVYIGINVSPINEIYITYFVSVVGKESYSFMSKPTAYDMSGNKIKTYTEPDELTAIEGGGEEFYAIEGRGRDEN